MSAFQTLGLPPCLVLAEDELREAFRAAGKTAHPDAGGGEGEFAALREAHAILSSPSRRLKHWLEIHGIAPDPRGTIGPSLMDLFTLAGAATQKAETLIRKRDEAKSLLVRAMLEADTQICREEVENAISQVDGSIARECSIFPELEIATELDLAAVSQVVRDLTFLEKWKASLRSCYSRLV